MSDGNGSAKVEYTDLKEGQAVQNLVEVFTTSVQAVDLACRRDVLQVIEYGSIRLPAFEFGDLCKPTAHECVLASAAIFTVKKLKDVADPTARYLLENNFIDLESHYEEAGKRDVSRAEKRLLLEFSQASRWLRERLSTAKRVEEHTPNSKPITLPESDSATLCSDKPSVKEKLAAYLLKQGEYQGESLRDLAKVLGCSPGAIAKTSTWKVLQHQAEDAKNSRSKRSP